MSNDPQTNYGYQLGKFVKKNPKVIQGLLVTVLLAWGFGAYQDWSHEQRERAMGLATSLGFNSVEEMKELNEQGFNSKAEFNDATAKKSGFDNYNEMNKRVAQGIKSGKELAEAQEKAKLLKFESVDEMIDLQAKGFNNKSEKMAKDKADEADRLIKERAKLNDANYLQETYGIEAGVSCRPEVERLARYDFEWIDKWHETKFPSYLTKTFTPGVLTVVGDRIKFQNGFGAWQIMSYSCQYDTQTKKVVNASAQSR